MSVHFFALISRMRHIGRWGLMRNTQPENLQEHSYMTAVFAHALALVRRDILGLPADPDRAAAAALFHDAAELFTGDLPTPVKYFDPDLRAAYRRVEETAARRLLALLPESLRPAYTPLLAEQSDPGTDALVRAADKLAAYVKCLEELRDGNREFAPAARQTREKLDAMHSPEVAWFLEHCVPSFSLSLDEVTPEH
ncbi:MAG: 5'-deoxynucleotidase [Oscillospiraceae bacterium]|jgi:5'-deoxynucleotidase|nr:5'-deoxynucleotidase [Oscillospiraceae bacterium]